ncbi:Sec-independent protein translocase protein TatB [Pseudooceanicola sp. MF1-13]|uniref:Sec-independent protein translocase protein TatB n=1 Tax=Pseudooceanicola sp. MF1-13 TaxID=3379095 RepID=UPI003891C037
MFGMGWTELLLIGIVGLIVVGPKDLPVLFRNIGQFVGKARGMAREFSRAMEEAADQSGVKEATDTLKGLTNPAKYGLDKVKDATDFTKWEPGSNTAKLAEDRAEAAKKIHAASAEKASQRRAAEEAAAKAEATGPGASQADATPDAAAAPAAKPATDTAASAKAKTAKPKADKPKTAKPKAKPKTASAKATDTKDKA